MRAQAWRRFPGLLAAGLLMAALTGAARAQPATPPLQLDVELDPQTRRLDVVAELRPHAGAPWGDIATGRTDHSAHVFEFLLHPALAISSASSAGKPVRITAAGRSDGLQRWHAVLAHGAPLRIAYGGILPPLAAGLDHRDVLRALPPMSAPAGSFLPAGSGWYPQPAERFAYRVRLSVPAGQRALVPGRLTGETQPTDENGRYRASFEFHHPADGIDLMAGPWQVQERVVPRTDGETIRLRTYLPADLDATAGLAEAYLADSARYIERYSRLIGAYPFTEFSVVASALPTGFGMPTLTYLGAEVLRLPFIRATSLGHEVLHNWWGNGVFVDDAQGNWSEGLTTFMADYAYKEDESAAAAREMRLGWLRDFAALPPDGQPTLNAFRSRTHGTEAAIGYGKAAMLFVMLRDALGANTFDRGIALLWQARRFRPANWRHVQDAFEQASGRSLQDFFTQWLTRAGAPQVRIARAAVGGATRTHLTLDLEQTLPAYALRLPVEVVHADRSETHWVDVAAARTRVELDLSAPPLGVRLDPELRVWRRLDADQLPAILRQWIVAPAPRLVVPSDDAALRAAAVELAQRLFDHGASPVNMDDAGNGTAPTLVVGRPPEVDAALARLGAAPRPAEVAVRGSAQAWTVSARTGPPLAAISADSADALRALMRSLPHYGAQSWLVFDGRRVIARGVWPTPGTLVRVQAGAAPKR
ncbi:MAG: M1 family peptidase [Betaproteobacteria bacterium]|nr:MAG: M1 family peptidase [Betaproteobacteria bacterium]